MMLHAHVVLLVRREGTFRTRHSCHHDAPVRRFVSSVRFVGCGRPVRFVLSSFSRHLDVILHFDVTSRQPVPALLAPSPPSTRSSSHAARCFPSSRHPGRAPLHDEEAKGTGPLALQLAESWTPTDRQQQFRVAPCPYSATRRNYFSKHFSISFFSWCQLCFRRRGGVAAPAVPSGCFAGGGNLLWTSQQS